jgi:integrase
MPGHLNPRNLAALAPPAGKSQADFPDGGGLVLRVFAATGARTWVYRYRTATGIRRGLKLGSFPSLTLAEARRARDAAQVQIDRDGSDPAHDRRVATEAARVKADRPTTLDTLWDSYLEAARIGRHKARGTPKRQSSLILDEQRWRTHVRPALGAKLFADIKSGDVRAFVTRLASKGLAHATINGCGALLRGVLSYAVFQEWLAANPALGHATPYRTTGRVRVLSRDELSAVWQGLDNRKTAPMERGTALALMLVLTTLQRLGEVTGLRLDEIDFHSSTWTLIPPRTKGSRPHVVPLSPLALELIKEARLLPGSGEFIFPGRDAASPLDRRAATRAFHRLTTALDTIEQSATPRDLRRTGATMMTGELNIPRFIVSRVLGHAGDSGGGAAVTGVYDRNDYLREKRSALERWGRLIDEIVEGRNGSVVVALAGRKAPR